MANNEDVTYILKSKIALPNKLLQDDGTITDITGKVVINPVDAYDNKPALPNKFLNPDGTYSTLNEIISQMVDTELFVIVDELPVSGNPQKIYLLPDGDGGFIEYHYKNDKWDPIGIIEIDLSDYPTIQDMINAIEAAVLQTLETARDYADNKMSKAVEDAGKYTDTKTAEAVETANEYADGAASGAVTTANGYTDNQIKAAKEYTDTQIQNKITTVLGGEY